MSTMRFWKMTVILVYVSGFNNKEAADRITDCFQCCIFHNQLTRQYLCSGILIGSLSAHLSYCNITSLVQLVSLDHCYGNVEDAFEGDVQITHLGIRPSPTEMQVILGKNPVEKSIPVWKEESREELKDCFEVTDWEVYFWLTQGSPTR